MALQSKIAIFIGGKEITAFKEFTLDQRIDSHHYLEVVCRTDVLESTAGELSSETKNLLGELLTLQVSALDDLASYNELEFKGVVTSITSTKGFQHQNGDVVIIKAMSSTIIADDGPHNASFIDTGLSGILDKTFADYDKSKVETSFSPKNTSPLHYCVQSHESAFRFASRLAAQYGEWFYYDGKKLVFGKPEDGDEVVLTYGQDLQEFSLDLNPNSNNYKFFTNDYLADDQHEMATTQVSGNATGYNSFTSQKSDEMFAKETSVFLNAFNDPQLKQRLDKQVEAQKNAAIVKQVRVRGMSDNPGASLGKVVKVKGDDMEHGTFRVTKVVHSGNENGMYQNRFEGVTADIDAYPNTNITAYPKSDAQVGIVTENIDPDAYGRIKVEMAWQKAAGETTPWIRVLTPHGGGEKGFHFIPEVGEEVLVGFEGGNAERPYMLGSLYTGTSNPGGWKTDNNDIKAIRTRSGHTVEFNDLEGEETITISDKSTNIIHFNTKDKTLTIGSEEKLILKSKFISMYADDLEMHTKSTKAISETEFVAQTGDSNLVVLPGEIIENSPKVSIEGKTQTEIKGGKIVTNSTADTLISGAIVKLNS